MKKFDELMGKLDRNWIGNQSVLRKHLELVTQILQLGAYSLPRMVLESEKFNTFFVDAIKKDLFRCNDEIRKGIISANT